MRFTGSALVAATLALSAAAAPLPQNANGFASLLSNIPIIGTFLGGAGGAAGSASPAASTNGTVAAAGAAGNPLATLQQHLPAPGSGMEGLVTTGQILGDHFRYTVNPLSSLDPIDPKANSPARELHRDAHAAGVPASMKPASS